VRGESELPSEMLAPTASVLGTTSSDPDKVVQLPTHPDYNPIALSIVLEKDPVDIFEQEPRIAAWAAQAETLLREDLAADFAVFGKPVDVQVECRASSCVVEVLVPKDERPEVFAAYLGMSPIGETTQRWQRETDKGMLIGAVTLLGPSTRRDYSGFLAQARSKWKRTLPTGYE
jgi:hypothetical protein